MSDTNISEMSPFERFIFELNQITADLKAKNDEMRKRQKNKRK